MEFASPRLGQLYAYWQAQRGDRLAPRKDEIVPFDIRRLLPNIMIVEVAARPEDYRIRLSGTEVDRQNGRTLTGLRLVELFAEARTLPAIRDYALVVERRAPVHNRRRMAHVGRDHVEIERLILPLSSDGERVDHLLCIFDYRSAVPPAR